MQQRTNGFTLIELVVTVSVLAIFIAIAIPSFADFRQRTTVRAAANQAVSFWANARMEALKRNSNITVSMRIDAGKMCMGADTRTGGCDCFAAACNVASYPSSQEEWKGARWVGEPSLGGSTATADLGTATISPKSGALTDPTHVGGVMFSSGREPEYQLQFYADRWGRSYLCEPTDAPHKLAEYSDRRCSP